MWRGAQGAAFSHGIMNPYSRAAHAFVVAVATQLVACHATPPPQLPYDFSNGTDVIRAMHDRYVQRWFYSLTMVQHNIATNNPSDTTESIYLTAVQPPYRMRIDYVPRDLQNGVLVLRDTQYVMANAQPVAITRYIDPIFLLQHAVYYLPPDETIARLRELGVNVDRVAQSTWDGRAMFVLGDPPGADGHEQVWIDRELMLLVRFLGPSPRDRTTVAETRLMEYSRMSSQYVPMVIERYENGTRVLRQENRQIRANQRLDTLLFLPYTWRQARHWYQQALIR